MGAFIRSKNVLLAELSEGAFIRRGALIRRNTVCDICIKKKKKKKKPNFQRVRVMVFNATFNNISAISWQSVLLVEEIGVPPTCCKSLTN